MRRTVTVALAVLVVAVGTAGVGTAVAEAAPEIAHGTYLAYDGTTADGARVDRAAPLTDAPLGTCFDLLTPDGHPATWAHTVNGTDRLAQLSEKACTDTGPAPARLLTVAPGWAGGGDAVWRSVRFSSMP